MNCVIEIDGREAVPVRAIPFIAGWLLSPDALASSFAQSDFNRLGDLRANHITPDGQVAKMLPKEWDTIEARLLSLSISEQDGEWDVSCLPSHCFVWRDEFEESFRRAIEKTEVCDARPGDKELNFDAFIPSESWDAVLEGMPQPGAAPANPSHSEAPVPRMRAQESRVLEIIKNLGYDPESLPKPISGRKGVKAEIRQKALEEKKLFLSHKVFESTWERLSGGGEISYKEKPKKE
jgi:hypothetical protein